jgi:hypothetical protein
LEIIERLIRAGVYMGPLNLAIAGYGGGTLGRNPFDWMEMVRRVPQGSVATFWSSMRGLISLSAMAIVLGQHVRVGNEDNLWGPDKKRRTTVQQIEGAVRIRKLLDPYKTPAWVTLALIPHLPELIGKIWEPASGSGKMVAALRQAGFDVWWQATSLRAWTSWVGRRRRVSARSSPMAPYALAREFIERALHFGTTRIVAMLLRTDFGHAA